MKVVSHSHDTKYLVATAEEEVEGDGEGRKSLDKRIGMKRYLKGI